MEPARHRVVHAVELHVDAGLLEQLGGDHGEGARDARLRRAAAAARVLGLVRHGVVGGAETDVDDADLLLREALVGELRRVAHHQIEQRAEGLRNDAHLIDRERDLAAVSVRIEGCQRVPAEQQPGELLAVPAVEAHRQPGHQVDRVVRRGETRERRHGHGLGEVGDELILIEGEGAYVALVLGELADEERLTVELDVQMLFGRRRAQQLLAKRDIAGLAENRLEHQRVPAVSCLCKPETDIDTNDVHAHFP